MARDMDMIRLGAEMSEYVFPGAQLPAPNERVITRGGGQTFKPYFYAAKNGNDLVISVRGAAEPGDFMIVLDFTRVDFAGGKAHKGVLESARWIIEQCRKYIDECTGRIICCGHSLGGATSAMITAVLVLEEHKQNVFAVSMAPFPILTQDLCQQLENNISSFAFRNDIVPRLSSKNIGILVRSFVGPPGPQQQQQAMFLQGIVSQLILGILQYTPMIAPGVAQQVQVQIPGITQKLLDMANRTEENEFYLPGKAFYLGYDEQQCPLVRPFTEADSNSNFNILALMSSMSDHSGEFYTEILYSIDELE
ncbi:lipase [Tritrichomonas foetus]|uniref:Lipase n=1 Tax=Tritrichomonas foetus TaxID=1144522 RepID=A0A1J4JDP6_9EUKA|nr:lipase [Tritrichomonas foetus]|eukprot:OHS96777.1 lipase [Tritrichomonas foetus]